MLGTLVLEKLEERGSLDGTLTSIVGFWLWTEGTGERYTIELSPNVQLWVCLEKKVCV